MKTNKVKKLVCFGVLLAMFASTGAGYASKAQNSPAKTEAIDTKTVDTYTVFISGSLAANINWDNPVAEEITKKTGVKLKFDIALGDPNQKISLMASSGQYDDIILNTDTSISAFVKLKTYVNLDPLIQKYGPNIKKFYGSLYNRLRYTTADKSIYCFGIGGGFAPEITPGFYWNQGFWLQNDALKALGYPKIKTPTDFENAIKAYLKSHPTTPDGSKRYGITLPTSDGFRYQFSIVQPAAFVNGLPNNSDYYYNPYTKKVELAATQSYYKNYLKWYNKMYNEGLIDPESFTENYDAYASKVAQGRSVGLIDSYWQFSGPADQLRKGNKGGSLYTPFTPLVNPAKMKWMADQPGNVTQAGGFSITTSCKNPAKVVNFFNYLASEEGQILTEWGIKGVNYTEANGLRVRKPQDITDQQKDPKAFGLKTGVQLYARDYGEWLHQPYGYKTANGQLLNSDDATHLTDAYNNVEKATLAKYNAKNFTDLFPKVSSMPVRSYGALDSLSVGLTDETKVAQKKLSDMRLQYIVKCVTCKPNEFDKSWQDYQNDLKAAGADKFIAELNASLTDRLKLWGLK